LLNKYYDELFSESVEIMKEHPVASRIIARFYDAYYWIARHSDYVKIAKFTKEFLEKQGNKI
jgi:hypothetical protein